MMQSLEAACEEGERALKRFKSNRAAASLPLLCPQDQSASTSSSASSLFGSLTRQPTGFYGSGADDSTSSFKSAGEQDSSTFDIFAELEKLCEEEENLQNQDTEFDDEQDEEVCWNVTYQALLLEKLVARERLNTVIFNLYPGNKGYSLAFRLMSRTDPNYMDIDETANTIETNLRPYDEEDLLRYIDKEELPPFLIDILDQFTYLFYSGCVIAEVRDFRQFYPQTKCDIHYVLLRPTQKSLLADINNLMEDRTELTNDDRDSIESELIAAHAPDLFLDPDPHIENEMAEINNRRYMWNTNKYRRIARKFSQVTVNKKRKLNLLSYRHGLEFYEYLNKVKLKPKMGVPPTARNVRKVPDEIKPVPVPNLDSPLLSPPPEPIAINGFKAFPSPSETSDCLPQLIEEYVLETDIPSKDKGPPRVYHIKLSIFQRPTNGEFLGELYLDRDYKKNEQNGVACRFSLGSRANANRYIHQFTEIFSESGRKQVRIRYGLSQGYRDRMAMAQAQVQQIQCQSQQQQPPPNQPNLARDHLSQLQTALQQTQQTCSTTPTVVNGALPQNINLVPQAQVIQNAQPAPNLQPQVATQKAASTMTSPEQEISALAMMLRNSGQQFQAAANAKQQAQQQQHAKFQATNAAIINLLNRSPASSVNSDTSAAVVNALTNHASLQPQRLLARKMTLSNVGGPIGNARVLNHNNLIALNNNRVNLNELNAQLAGQPTQTVTLTAVNNYTMPVKQQVVHQRIIGSSSEGNKALSALLVGTPAADRPDIAGTSSNSLLLEKLASATPSGTQGTTTQFIQSPKTPQQFMVQSPKGNTVISPMSSPPPQTGGTINVQSLNLGQQQGIGLQNFQVQLYPGFAQPISLLNVSSANLQGQPTSLLMSMPVTTVTQSSNTIAQGGTGISVSSNNLSSLGMGGQTVVLANAGSHQLAQLVSSGVKGIQQPNLRPQTVSLTQGGQQFQLISQLQRSRPAQTANASTSQLIQQPRTIQRTPITIKMASPTSTNPATSQVTTLPLIPGPAALPNQELKTNYQDYQEMCRSNLNQPKNIAEFFENYRRNSTEKQ